MTNEPCAELLTYFDEERERLLVEYFEFLKIPSISSEPEYTAEVTRCAEWVHGRLSAAGFSVEQWDSGGHPTIYAEWIGAGKNKPTVMFYGHYDVQPVDPMHEWISPPFDPTVRDGEVYARGAQDNKGQTFYVIAALRSILKRRGALPVNVKLVLEGEEECGSVSLSRAIAEKRKKLKADHLLVVDVGIYNMSAPSVTLGVRGIVTFTLEITGSKTDLHSGMHGGIVYNPNRALTELLAGVYDENGRVTIPGFYDAVAEMSATERSEIRLSFEDDDYRAHFGAEPTGGEKGFTPFERAWLRPTFEINGVSGGYAGVGFKTVIPAKATAKCSCRLVPNQDPEVIRKLVVEYFKKRCPAGVSLTTTPHPGGGKPVRADINAPVTKAAARAYSEVFGKPCEYILEGGSIPIVTELAEASSAEVVLIGYGLPGDMIHAPNEHFGLERLRQGYATIGRIVEILGE